MQSVVSYLNSLDLPINFYTASDSSSANVSVFYGSYPYLEERMGLKNRKYEPFAGVGYTHKSNSEIEWAKVGIANDARKYEYITPNVPLVSLTNVPDISLLNVPLFTGCN